MRYAKRRSQAGTTLIEVLVAIGLTGIMLPALVTAVVSSSVARPTATQQIVASGMLQSLSEATRSVRDNGWANVATDGTYYPVASSGLWTLSSGTETAGIYSEQIVISDVSRDSTGAIVSNGGVVDPSTKLITATVSWSHPVNTTIHSQFYVTRWPNETAWTQTTAADFSGDNLTNTVVTDTAGGEVQVAAGQTSGTIESSSFDAGNNVGFNNLSFSDSLPSGTSISLQVAGNNDNSTWNYVGPDGTAATTYNSAGAVPLAISSSRYFRYKATLSGSADATPILNDVTVTYSP